MFRISRQIVRLGLVLMVFQFLAPAFMPIVVQEMPSDKVTAYYQHHNSVVAPMLLKEKDEKEHEEIFSVTRSTPLLDLTSHSSNLAASHANKHQIVRDNYGLPQEPLFTLFCSFLI